MLRSTDPEHIRIDGFYFVYSELQIYIHDGVREMGMGGCRNQKEYEDTQMEIKMV